MSRTSFNKKKPNLPGITRFLEIIFNVLLSPLHVCPTSSLSTSPLYSLFNSAFFTHLFLKGEQPWENRISTELYLPAFISPPWSQLIFTIVVVAGIIVLAVWLVLRPAKIKVHVDTVSLTDFNLSGGNTLRYNLSLSISVRNPNRRIGIYYKKLEASTFYKGQRIQSAYLPTFYQGHKNTSMLYPVFSGQQFLALNASDLSDYNQQKSQRRFRVDVKIYLRISLKVWRFKTISYRPDADCKLTIPLLTKGEENGNFTRTKCDIDL